jgi:hypothetical protein
MNGFSESLAIERDGRQPRTACGGLANRQRKTVVAGLDPAIHGPGEVEMAPGKAAMMKGFVAAGRSVGIGPSFAHLARGWPGQARP